MSERNEAPTGKRISEAREQGQVARSVELNAAAGMLIGAIVLKSIGLRLIGTLEAIIHDSMAAIANLDFSPVWLRSWTISSLLLLLPDVGLMIVGMLLSGVVITLMQTGFLWATKRIGFDASRVNPINGFKRLFSTRGIIELLKALVKLGVMGWLGYGFIRDNIAVILRMASLEYSEAIGMWCSLAYDLAMKIGMAFIVFAIADYAYQKYEHNKSMKMTKDEVKEDRKQTEGDPFLKGRIKGRQRQMARLRMMASVPEADVVITNPTHLAVAIQYDSETMHAPTVKAKGAFGVAERIVKLAQDNNIPVMQNIPLARALYRTVEIDQPIPPDLYIAMAEVLAYVFGLKEKKKRGRPILSGGSTLEILQPGNGMDRDWIDPEQPESSRNGSGKQVSE
jgi:flagellar biosynthetic protein FlhB